MTALPYPAAPATQTHSRPRVLYVAHRVPFPPDKGDRIRNYHVLRALSRRAAVSLLCLADEPVPAGTRAELESLTEQFAAVPVSPKLRWLRAGASLALGKSLSEGAFREPAAAEVLTEWQRSRPFDAAVVSASSLVPYLKLPCLKATPAFVDLVDVDSQKWLDFAAAKPGPKRLMYRLEARRVRKLEASLPAWCRGVSLVSRHEAAVFDGFTRAGAATVATNGVDLTYFAPQSVPEVPALAFVGALDYLPNVDAACWFAAEIWAKIRALHPACEFRLIGRKPAPAVQALAAIPGVKLVGQVPDVRPHVASAAVVVVPMRLSRGLQNKVLESLAMAKATVAAPPALAALSVEPGTHLLKAETPDDWVAAVDGLLTDPARRAALGRAGRGFVEANHDWDTCLAPLTDRILAACRT